MSALFTSPFGPALVGLAFIAFWIIAAYVLWKKINGQIQAWAEFASRHGMNAQHFHIEGSYEGYPLKVVRETRPPTKNGQTIIVLRLAVRGALPPEFSLEREGLGDKVLRFFGKQDTQIGDTDFDKHFDLKNVSPEMEEVLRQPAVQQHLYEMTNHYRLFFIRDGWIQAEQRKVPSTVEELEAFTGPALMLAHTLEEAAQRIQRRTTR